MIPNSSLPSISRIPTGSHRRSSLILSSIFGRWRNLLNVTYPPRQYPPSSIMNREPFRISDPARISCLPQRTRILACAFSQTRITTDWQWNTCWTRRRTDSYLSQTSIISLVTSNSPLSIFESTSTAKSRSARVILQAMGKYLVSSYIPRSIKACKSFGLVVSRKPHLRTPLDFQKFSLNESSPKSRSSPKC